MNFSCKTLPPLNVLQVSGRAGKELEVAEERMQGLGAEDAGTGS